MKGSVFEQLMFFAKLIMGKITMKKKKIIIIVISVLFALGAVVAVLALNGVFRNTDPIYGTFEYVKADGSVAVVTMTEKYAYFENVPFEGSEQNSAYLYAKDEFNTSEEKIDNEKLRNRIEELVKDMDYDIMFNGKTVAYTDVKYIEEYNQYYYYITNGKTGKHGLSLCVDLSTKTLSIADMMFKLKE